MNFQPTDYLQDLNLDFDTVSPNMETPRSDLDLFSQADFFDLDVLSQKPVKQEKDVSLDFLNLPLPYGQDNGQSPATSSPDENTFKKPESPFSIGSGSGAVEDKRKRNTAASARFRIKKKMKEQEMEKKSKELQDRLQSLEKKLKTLEMENKCLKNLILQQNEQKNTHLLESIKKRSILDSKPVFQYTN